MKEGLVRLTGEKDIFYDSVEKVFRYRMHCPKCGVTISTCRCYFDLDRLLDDIDEGIANYTCSFRCALKVGEWDTLNEAMSIAVGNKSNDELIKTLSDTQIAEFLNGHFKDRDLLVEFRPLRREYLLTTVRENNLDDDLIDHCNIERGKTIDELTEQECKAVLDILTDGGDGDFDYPGGEDCTI